MMLKRAIAGLTLSLCLATVPPVMAAESGSGVYILGSRSSGAGVTPPEGIFFTTQGFGYRGKAGGNIPLENGSVAVSLKARANVSINSLTWVTPLEMLGGRVGVSATIPFGLVKMNAGLGPLRRSDSVFTTADQTLTAFIGWNSGPLHLQLGASAYLPYGDYRKGELANIAKHRGAGDVALAMTYLVPGTGFDITNIIGLTVSVPNAATKYRTGNEFHWDWAISHKWDNGLTLGAIGYYYQQLTGDSGAGTKLGDFKGRVTSLGAMAGYDFKLGQLPVTTRLRFYREFNERNRLKGDSAFLSVSVPLWVAGTAAKPAPVAPAAHMSK